MAEQVFNEIKPILLEKLNEKIKEHKNDFDEVEKGVDLIIEEIRGKIKPVVEPIVSGIKLIPKTPLLDPDKNLKDLSTKIKTKINDFDMSELEKIEGLQDDIKTRIVALQISVKTKLNNLIDELIDGDKATIPADGSGSSSTEGSSAKATGAEVHVNNADTNGSVDENYKITSVEAANILEELKKTLGDNDVFNSLIDAACAIKAKQGSNGVEAGPEAKNDASEKPSTEAAETKTEAAETKTDAAETKTDAAETKTDAAETKTDAAETKTEVAATKTAEADAKGGAKKRRRKTKKNIRRPKKSYTKFDRKF